jgi:Protein of unknown function (DUF3789)
MTALFALILIIIGGTLAALAMCILTAAANSDRRKTQ